MLLFEKKKIYVIASICAIDYNNKRFINQDIKYTRGVFKT